MRLALLLCCATLAAHAADYYVSPSGNDNNPGTFAEPWALTAVCRATRSATPMNALSPGDTVWFRGGKYPTTQTMYCEHTTTADARITHRAYPGETPVIAAQPPVRRVRGAAGHPEHLRHAPLDRLRMVKQSRDCQHRALAVIRAN